MEKDAIYYQEMSRGFADNAQHLMQRGENYNFATVHMQYMSNIYAEAAQKILTNLING